MKGYLFKSAVVFAFLLSFSVDGQSQLSELKTRLFGEKKPHTKTIVVKPDLEMGRQLFLAHCSRCHSPLLEFDMTAPALYGLLDRVPSREWLYRWIPNSSAVIASCDSYALALKWKWKTVMDAMPLGKPEIDAILAFIGSYEPPLFYDND